MRVILCENYEEMSKQASKLVASQLILKPDSVLGLATGSTPIGLYDNLIEMNKKGEIDFSNVTTFNLDEYYPIKKSNNQSYDYFMNEHLFSKVNIDKENTHIPNGETENPAEECKNYEKLIRQNGGIDLQILGIGTNGHIGFNEPATLFDTHTHTQQLTDSTKRMKAQHFGGIENVPDMGVTMGLKTICSAKNVILVAFGEEKAEIIHKLVYGKTTTYVPAAMLQMHMNMTLCLDKEAAAKLD